MDDSMILCALIGAKNRQSAGPIACTKPGGGYPSDSQRQKLAASKTAKKIDLDQIKVVYDDFNKDLRRQAALDRAASKK